MYKLKNLFILLLMFITFTTSKGDEHMTYLPFVLNYVYSYQASCGNKLYGSSVYRGVIDNADDWLHFVNNFSIGTPEVSLKMEYTQPAYGVWDFTKSDYVVNSLVEENKKVFGHNIFWHIFNPSWFEDGNFSKSQIEQMAYERIDKLVSHYDNTITDWDLANELINEYGTYRDTKWNFGYDYLGKVFEYAHSKYPDKNFWYNDVFGQYGLPDGWKNRIRELARSGNLYGVGFQLHIDGWYDKTVAWNEIMDFSRELGFMGVRVRISELDVQVRTACPDNCYEETGIYQTDFENQSVIINDAYNLCADLWNCTDVTWWGINDDRNWRSSDKYPAYGYATNWYGDYYVRNLDKHHIICYEDIVYFEREWK